VPGSRSTLHAAFDPRSNAVTAMRLALAGVVAVVHALAVGFGHQPVVNDTTLGDLAVDAFFVLSGFLVTGSLVRTRSVARYLWHRALRIMPGFWACLLVLALVVAPVLAVLQGRPAASVFTAAHDSAGEFVVRNAGLLMQQWGIAGLPEGVPEPGVLDGSLWTLFYEAVCYGAVVLLGVLGALQRPRLVAALVAGLWALTVAHALSDGLVQEERLLRFTFLFLLGTLAYAAADRWWLDRRLVAVSVVLLAVGLVWLPDYRALAGPAFAYLVLYAMARLPAPRWPSQDYSYGLYVYHYPLEQVLVVAGLAAWGQVPFVVVAIVLAMGAAALSWRLVERPALSWKSARWVDRLPAPHLAARSAAPYRTEPAG
jgi:peptidoglycan/LPS O-acetylase OafA/YrhL